MSKIISEYQFRQWYLIEGLTTYQIADICKVSRRSVFRWMRKWKIEAIPRKRAFEAIKNQNLTERQKELLVGTLLGDGCLGKHGQHSRLHVGHCEIQKGLVDWLWQEFQPFSHAPSIRKEDRRGNSVMWSFTTITHQDFDLYNYLFYDQKDNNRVKIVRPEIENMLTPLSLAVWFMDDGSVDSKSHFSTEGFTKDDNEMLSKMLKRKFNINSVVEPYANRPYFRLTLPKKDSLELGKLINSNLVPCMKYKAL